MTVVSGSIRASAPESVLKGSRRGADLNAAMDAISSAYRVDGRQRTLYLDGLYTLEIPVLWRPGVRVQCGPDFILAPDVDLTGGVDDPANSLVVAEGSAVGGTSTTIAVLNKDDDRVALSAIIDGLAVGDYIQVWGNNASSNSTSDSDGPLVVLYEILKVAALIGTTVVFATPAMQYHAYGVSVRKYLPVTDIAWDGGYFDGTASQIACAMRLRGVLGWKLADDHELAFRGFTRRAVEVDTGSSDYEIGELISDGLNNGLLGLSSTGPGLVDTLRSVRGRERENLATGAVPRGMLYMNHRNTATKFSTIKFETVHIGVRLFGGRELVFDDVWIDDVDPLNAYLACVAAGEMDSGGTIGGAWTMDTGVAAMDEVCQGLKINNIVAGYMKSPVEHIKRWWTIFYHDARWLDVKSSRVANNGAGSNVSANYPGGQYVRDSSGWMGLMENSGLFYGYYATGQLFGLIVERCVYNGSVGDGAGLSAGYPLLLDTEGRVGFRIDSLEIGNVNFGYIEFGALFLAQPDWDLSIGRITSPEGVFGRSVLGFGGTNGSPITTWTMGDLVALSASSPSGERHFETATAPNTKGAVVSLSQYRNGGGPNALALIAPLPSEEDSHVLVTGTGSEGDLVVQSGTAKQGIVAATPAAYTAIGRLLEAKAASGAALTKVRRA